MISIAGGMEPDLWTEVPLERVFVACEPKAASHIEADRLSVSGACSTPPHPSQLLELKACLPGNSSVF